MILWLRYVHMVVHVIRHLISGDAFFTGIGMILVGAIWRESRWFGHPTMSTCLSLLGAALIVCSATPLPAAAYVLLAALTMMWLILGAPPQKSYRLPQLAESEPTDQTIAVRDRSRSGQHIIALMMFAGWAGAGAYELTWCVLPRVPLAADEHLIILGDSVTAGLGEQEAITWPRLLIRDHHVQVLDLSRVGETVGQGLEQVRGLNLPGGIVVIELGGNDILGTTTVAQFRSQLDTLLKSVADSSRRIVMFEIPLPPTGNRYGQIQRELAVKYHARLIPKEVLADVLLSKETTLDSIHLTQKGHDHLAEVVWKIVRP